MSANQRLFPASLLTTPQYRLQFSEYQFSLTKAQIGDLAKVAVESVLQSLLNDTLKVLQAVMGSMSLERIDACFHDYIVQMLAPVASSFSTQAKSHSIADATKTSVRNTTSYVSLGAPVALMSPTKSYLSEASLYLDVVVSPRKSSIMCWLPSNSCAW